MPSSIIQSFAQKTGKSVKEVEAMWDRAKGVVAKQYPERGEEGEGYYKLVTGVLKKMLGESREVSGRADRIMERYGRQ